jgi:hypothetical protein
LSGKLGFSRQLEYGQETRNVTDAFDQAAEVCAELGLNRVANSYTAFMNALDRYRGVISGRLRLRFQELAEEVGGRFWRRDDRVFIGFHGLCRWLLTS